MRSAESDSCRGNQAAVRFEEESSHAVPCNYVVIVGLLLAPTYAQVQIPQGRIFSQSKTKELG